jgi:hypothetical protein
MRRRLARLESERGQPGPDAEEAKAQAEACAVIGAFLDAIAAEKAAGDVHGVAAREIAEALAALDRRA